MDPEKDYLKAMNWSLYQDMKDRCMILEDQLKEAEEVIQFYAARRNWEMQNQVRHTRIRKEDQEAGKNFAAWFGGKRARAYLEKYETTN